jgi:hypothetical protein
MITIIFIFIAAILNASMDVVSTKWVKSFFNKHLKKYEQFFNPQLSWRNKWKNGDPKQGERFPLSSTMLVFLTDWWHLAKSSMILSFCISIVFYTTIFGLIDILIFYIIFGVIFELFYAYILV